MLPFLLTLLLFPSSLPQEPGSDLKDSVLLRSGGFVDGTILDENETVIVVEMAPGARVEVAKSDVASVRRAPRRPPAATASRPAAAPPAIELEDRWYLVRNALGEVVGTRRLRVAPDPAAAGNLRFEETLSLRDEEGKRVRIQRIETADRELKPRECHYREISEGTSSTVEASLQGDALVIETLDDDGRSRTEVPGIGKVTFPLLFRESLRRAPPGGGESVSREVYDPLARTIVRRAARGERPRRLAQGDEEGRTHEVFVVSARGVESVVWHHGREIEREELNGPDLVAIPCTEEDASKAETEAPRSPWSARDGSGRIALVLPGPDWRFERTTADALALTRKDGRGSAVACALDLEPDVTAAGAALLLERRLSKSLARYERTGGFEECVVSGLPAARFEFRCDGEGGSKSGVAVAVRGKGSGAACVLTCEPVERTSIAREFDRLLNRAELRF